MAGFFSGSKVTGAVLALGLGACLAWSPPAAAAPTAEPALSPVQQKLVARRIAALKSPGERRIAGDWSNAKKAAELICRPAALPVLRRQIKDADKVFLGTSDPATLRLVSNRRLEGIGQVRAGAGWRDLTFVCLLDPATGKAAGFRAILKP